MSLRHPTGWKLKTEADVVVRLLHPNNHFCLLALPLHSHVLVTRSRFFAARLSGRWEHKLTDDSSTHINSNHHSNDSSPASSSNANATTFGKGDDLDDEYDATLHKEPLEHMGLHLIDIAMPNPSAAALYKKCLELMYVPQNCTHSCRPFSNVEDAISMLHVAAELLFDDCINDCMQCLEMLPSWTAEESSSIRSTLSSLQLPHINADLAARLSLSQSIPSQQPMYTIRRMLGHVLQLACERLPTPPPALKTIDTSKPIPEAMVLLVWNANLDIMKTKLNQKVCRSLYDWKDVETVGSTLSWLLGKLLDLEAADAVVRAFTKDTQLSNVIVDLLKCHTRQYNNWVFINPVLSLLNQIMPLVFGKILLSQCARITLLTTWLPVAQGLNSSDNYMSHPNIVDGILKLISSLPVLDREQIYKKSMKLSDSSVLSLNSSFGPWCEMLRQLHLQHGEGQEGLLANEDV